MALGLHVGCLQRLKEVTSQALDHITVTHRKYLDFPSTFRLALGEQALPAGKLRVTLENYIGEVPLFSFLYESLARELSETQQYDLVSESNPLKNISGYEDSAVVAGRLIDAFESLPWSFRVSLEIPEGVGQALRKAFSSYALGTNLRLVCPDEKYDEIYPLRSAIDQRNDSLFGGRTILALGEPRRWNIATAYLQAVTEGFIARYRKSAPLENAIAAMKSFLGLALAVRLTRYGEGKIGSPFGIPPKSYFVVHRQVANGWEVWSTHELPPDLAGILTKIEIHDLDGHLEQDNIVGWIQTRLSIISRAFDNPNKAERIILAAQWLLDSYIGGNELLSFVQSTVAMEILLGEEAKSDIIGIGELLRNRCAYLIGKTHDQRAEILRDFDLIYGVRSRIVHRGKSRLTGEERMLFHKLQWMCRRVISEELDLIGSDSGATIWDNDGDRIHQLA